MFAHFGLGELLVLLFIVLLLFGPRRLPELAGSIGKSIRLFKEGLKDGKDHSDDTPASKPSDTKPS